MSKTNHWRTATIILAFVFVFLMCSQIYYEKKAETYFNFKKDVVISKADFYSFAEPLKLYESRNVCDMQRNVCMQITRIAN